MEARATVIVPTFGQAFFAQWAVKSVQNQRIKDIEICIICDGSPESMVTFFKKMAQEDPRIKVFTFPKSPRTGEPYRDLVIKQTTGKIICYCSHDDLWLPNHLQEIEEALKKCRFAHSLHAVVNLPEKVRAEQRLFDGSYFKNIKDHNTYKNMFRGINFFGLTFGAHTRDSYFKLEEGWVTTPRENATTDLYMWCKFLAAFPDECKTIMKITALSFPYKPRKEWPEQQRDDELKYYFERIQDPDFVKTISKYLLRFKIKRFIPKRLKRYGRWLPLHLALQAIKRTMNRLDRGRRKRNEEGTRRGLEWKGGERRKSEPSVSTKP
ncbi:MAG TPA: glycosyltransferase family A protein [Thermodesulfobacteriota bacterium]|nr:glycosyltransferase family A protein [Thermodesulfobacteriota bacterium]